MAKILDVPYFSQLDNELNASGACNVTSISMVLYSLGLRGDGSYPQLEDQLYQRCLDNGWSRHDPYGLKKLVESYGYKDELTERGTLHDIRKAIDDGNPCVVHGYFTKFGHIVTIIGYDDHGFVVNDPYGEWFATGYNCNVSGERLHYSNELIAEVCSPESADDPQHIWLHRISRAT